MATRRPKTPAAPIVHCDAYGVQLVKDEEVFFVSPRGQRDVCRGKVTSIDGKKKIRVTYTRQEVGGRWSTNAGVVSEWEDNCLVYSKNCIRVAPVPTVDGRMPGQTAWLTKTVLEVREEDSIEPKTIACKNRDHAIEEGNRIKDADPFAQVRLIDNKFEYKFISAEIEEL